MCTCSKGWTSLFFCAMKALLDTVDFMYNLDTLHAAEEEIYYIIG